MDDSSINDQSGNESIEHFVTNKLFQLSAMKQRPSPRKNINNLEMSPISKFVNSPGKLTPVKYGHTPTKYCSTPVQGGGHQLASIQEEDFDCRKRTFQMYTPSPSASGFSTLPLHESTSAILGEDLIVKNPFDSPLLNKLHLNIFSPSVFTKVVSPSQDSQHFAWTIEDISKINPAPIECSVVQYENDVDPLVESQAQEAIDRYFCEHHIAPSPWAQQKGPFLTPESPHKSEQSVPETRTVSTQTLLNLPAVIPPALEEALKPYLMDLSIEASEDANMNISTLRRKLHFSESEGQLSPIRQSLSPAVSCLAMQGRTYGTPLQGVLEQPSPPISPIANTNTLRTNTSCEIMETSVNLVKSSLGADEADMETSDEAGRLATPVRSRGKRRLRVSSGRLVMSVDSEEDTGYCTNSNHITTTTTSGTDHFMSSTPSKQPVVI